MSVHRRNQGWRVIWRDGGRQRSQQFDRKADADAFDREIKRRKQLERADQALREMDRRWRP